VALALASTMAMADLGPPDLAPMVDIQTTYGWGAVFGWPANSNPCPTAGGNNWNGVSCNRSGRVTNLVADCGSTTLQSAFPSADIAQLTGLSSFDVPDCYVSSQPASNFGGLDSLSNLIELNLQGDTGINGTLADIFPGDVGATDFPNLCRFNVSDTGLGGAILGGLMQKGVGCLVWLNDSKFSGTLPATGVSPVDLQLQGNELQGVVPGYIVNAPTQQGGVRIGLDYNMFDAANTPSGTIDTFDPTWRQTQTVPPANVQVTQTAVGSATLSWTPIAYQGNGGYYEVLSSQTQGGPYTLDGTTTGSGGKTASGLTVSGLPSGTNYFVVRTLTPAHVSQPLNPATDNPNDLTSVDSSEANADIPFATPSVSTSQQPSSATVGGLMADQASVSGGSGPTGTVTFTLYNNSNGTGTPLFTDANEPLSGGMATSKGYTAANTGTDYWVATYNGDSNNNSVSSGTSAEPVTITAASKLADLSVTISGPSSAADGSILREQITVKNAGPGSAGSVLTVLDVPGGVTVTDAGGGTYAFGTVWWTASQIQPSGKIVYTVTFKVGPHARGTVLIPAATVSLTNPDPNYKNNVTATTVNLGGGPRSASVARRLRDAFPAGQQLASALLRLTRRHHALHRQHHGKPAGAGRTTRSHHNDNRR
jgi:hypothetical protein